jgi:hypothetical protein
MRRALITVAVVAAVCTAGLPVSDAATAARVQVSPGTADPDYATNVTVTGRGFQSIKGGFGGIYVMFGTVDAHWRPSQRGQSGVDYDYVHDAETKANHGFLKFVSFPGGSTEAEANGGVISPDGSWRTTLVIPRATFPAVGRNGATRQVDCRQVQCGVITIGAHGVVSPDNETFTPVRFAAPGAVSPAPRTSPSTRTSVPPVGRGGTATPKSHPEPSPARSTRATSSAAPPPSTTPPITPSPVADTRHNSSSAGWIAASFGVLAVAGLASGGLWLRRRRITPTDQESS